MAEPLRVRDDEPEVRLDQPAECIGVASRLLNPLPQLVFLVGRELLKASDLL
jgi:hypothetical protein